MDSTFQPIPLYTIRVYAQKDWSKTVAKAPEEIVSDQLRSSGVRTQITANQITPPSGLVVSNLHYVGADQMPGSNATGSVVRYLLPFSEYQNGWTAVFTQYSNLVNPSSIE